MLDIVLPALFLGVFLSYMIGPVFFVLLETSITKGVRAALSFDAGVILGDIAFISIAYFSSFQFVKQLKDEPLLYYIGGAIMSIFGLISLLQLLKKGVDANIEMPTKISQKSGYLKLFAKGFFLNFINVGVLGFWLGILVTVGPQYDMQPQKIFWFFALAIVGYLLSDLVKIFLAKKLKKKLTPKNIFIIKKISAWVLIIFGLVVAFKPFFLEEL